jgi:hypothetical protein
MTIMRRLSLFASPVVAVLLAGCSHTAVITASAPVQVAASPAPPALPTRLNDREFWALETDISEPGGYFQITDNFTSNEMEVGQLFTMLRTSQVSGGVYLGVGPEQNFTYIAAIRPKMAFIVDIRRQAVVQHLMFKAMFELAADRADFISILFAKPRPSGVDTATSIQQIWEAYRGVRTDSGLAAKNYARVLGRLTKTHGFTLTTEEVGQLKSVFDAFYQYGPSITTRGGFSGRGGDFSDLTGFSLDATGQPKSFLSSEDNYRYVKTLHEHNLILPVSGDFAGPKAIRTIGAYLHDHAGQVSAFYVSNVEQYLFGDGHAQAFYENVALLPMDSSSVFIRPYSMRRGPGGPTRSLCPIAAFIQASHAGRVQDNNQALACIM